MSHLRATGATGSAPLIATEWLMNLLQWPIPIPELFSWVLMIRLGKSKRQMKPDMLTIFAAPPPVKINHQVNSP